jgi:hypothetical protein
MHEERIINLDKAQSVLEAIAANPDLLKDVNAELAAEEQAAAFERFLRDRHAAKSADLPFSQHYKAAIEPPRPPAEELDEVETPVREPARSAPLTLPFELYGKDRSGKRTRRTSRRARIEMRGEELYLTGYRDGGRKKGDDQKLHFLGVGKILASDKIKVPHLEVDLDEGTLELKVLPSRVALRERAPDSELARYCRNQVLGTPEGEEPAGPLSPVELEAEVSMRPSPTGSTDGRTGEAMLRDEAYGLVQAFAKQHTFVQADTALDQVASYDFAACEYLLEPEEGIGSLLPERLSDAALELLDGMEAAGLDTLVFIDFFQELEAGVLSAVVQERKYQPSVLSHHLLSVLYERDNFATVLNWLYRLYAAAERFRTPGSFMRYIASYLRSGIQSYEAQGYAVAFDSNRIDFENVWRHTWRLMKAQPFGAADFTTRQYPFTVFTPHSLNLGLRLVYRQDWRLLGVQPGEVVKTIPLGPGQSMKVSTKVVRRHKMDIARDTSRVVERSSESADTVKDSSEVVRETAESHNWEIAMEGSFGYGFGLVSAEVTRGPSYGGEVANKSTQRSSSLNEKVRKTASKTQTETKVHVATERESTFEQETATEIRNPNDEVAITYEYLHLQHLYETFTRLAEVDSVVFVAEDLPAPDEVNVDWVRRHAWILSKVLLDEAFRPALEDIVNDNDADDPYAGSTAPQMIAVLQNAASQFATFSGGGGSGSGGLTIPDIYAGAIKGYQDWAAEQHALARMRKARETRRQRLFEHIRDNVLHYCRAIWTHEDVEQRILRYRKRGINVPAYWRWYGPAAAGHPFVFHVTPMTGVEVPIERVIEPTPPVGFVGNYAVHRYRPLGLREQDDSLVLEKPLHLDTLMELLRGHYVDPDDDFAVLDPAFQQELEEAEAHGAQSELTDAQVLDVVHFLPRLRDELLDDEGNVLRHPEDQSRLLHPIPVADWAEYRFRKRHSDRVLFASGNLYLDLRVGVGSAMEPFKRLHRAVDVLKAIAEKNTMELENLRREMRLGALDYEDPDIERVTVVRTDQQVGVDVGVATDGDTAGG